MNTSITDVFLACGLSNPAAKPWMVECGPVQFKFESGDIRYLTVHGREVIRRIYAAVRDRNWGTVSGVISDLSYQVDEGQFVIRYRSEHRQHEIDFVWDAQILGTDSGAIEFQFDGLARSTFLKNRIGFCVLHPSDQAAGTPCQVTYTNGQSQELRFPRTIASEQPVHGFTNLAAMLSQIDAGSWLKLEFEGDAFETEDQRNWIDASFKTFCTPLRLPFPVQIKQGQRIQQRIRLSIVHEGLPWAGTPRAEQPEQRPVRIETDSPDVCPLVTLQPAEPPAAISLPPVGIILADEEEVTHDAGSLQRLHRLGLSHVRIDVRLSDLSQTWKQKFATAAEITPKVELAVHLDQGTTEEQSRWLREFVSTVRDQQVNLHHVLALGSRSERSTSSAVLKMVREAFEPFDVRVGAGTDADLYQMNLQPPPAEADFFFWSMNPQVHAFDCGSIAETPRAARDQLDSVADYYPDKPRVVTPVTLKPRFNPVATGPTAAREADGLPDSVDPRQMTLFAAGWTVAMLANLFAGRVESLTLFETIGWRGLLESDQGSVNPGQFPSKPSWVFPVYHVLADILEWKGASLRELKASAPLHVAGLALTRHGQQRWLLANLQDAAVQVQSTEPFFGARLRMLDLANARAALESPEDYRAGWQQISGNLVTIPRYGIATLDLLG